MKTKNNLTLIYDDLCPLCVWYTGLFVKHGLLTEENRLPFSKATDTILRSIDFDRAKDEIPLINTATHEVFYGIDALLVILEQRFSWIGSAGRITPVHWFLKKLYRFVSFNRKVVVARKCGKGDIDCSPSFNRFYRLLLLLCAFTAGMFILPVLHEKILQFVPSYPVSLTNLLLAALILATVNYTAALLLPKNKALEYLGQHAILCLILILTLLPMLAAASLIHLPLFFPILYLSAVATLVITEYNRRMQYVGNFPGVVSINATTSILFLLYLVNLIN